MTFGICACTGKTFSLLFKELLSLSEAYPHTLGYILDLPGWFSNTKLASKVKKKKNVTLANQPITSNPVTVMESEEVSVFPFVCLCFSFMSHWRLNKFIIEATAYIDLECGQCLKGHVSSLLSLFCCLSFDMGLAEAAFWEGMSVGSLS